MRISRHHAALYQQYYEARPTLMLPSRWIDRVETLAARLQAQTILDYGCGPGRGLSRFLTRPVRDYDPGVADLATAPRAADLVVCIHVLEHVEPASLDEVVDHLQWLARKAVFVVVSCEASTKTLPDGSPWHTLVRDASWWRKYLHDFVAQPCLKEAGKEYAALLEIRTNGA
jgi:Methyltransferase domain